jgi:hypothetical protein
MNERTMNEVTVNEVTMNDRGLALVAAVLASTLLMALVAAAIVTTTAEARIAASYVGARQAFYAAEAAAEWTIAELSALADWTPIATGAARLGFVDGPSAGTRALADGSVVDLDAIRAASRGWQLAAHGRLQDLAPSASPSLLYLVVFVSPDAASPDRLHVRGEAFGPRGAHQIVAIEVARADAGARLEAWTHVR